MSQRFKKGDKVRVKDGVERSRAGSPIPDGRVGVIEDVSDEDFPAALSDVEVAAYGVRFPATYDVPGGPYRSLNHDNVDLYPDLQVGDRVSNPVSGNEATVVAVGDVAHYHGACKRTDHVTLAFDRNTRLAASWHPEDLRFVSRPSVQTGGTFGLAWSDVEPGDTVEVAVMGFEGTLKSVAPERGNFPTPQVVLVSITGAREPLPTHDGAVIDAVGPTFERRLHLIGGAWRLQNGLMVGRGLLDSITSWERVI